MKLWEDRLGDSHPDSSWDEKLKNGLGECQVILVAEEIILKILLPNRKISILKNRSHFTSKTYGEFLPMHN